jgi:hypothetical protein
VHKEKEKLWLCLQLNDENSRDGNCVFRSGISIPELIFKTYYFFLPPLWSSGQSSWLKIRRPGFDSRHYKKKSSGSGTGSTQPREYN